MSGREHFTDRTGGQLVVAKSPHPGREGVLLDTNPEGHSQNFLVEPHRVAAVVTAMYEAAGQPVPVLPVIHDQAGVKALASMLGSALCKADELARTLPMAVAEQAARDLLAQGVRLPEATP